MLNKEIVTLLKNEQKNLESVIRRAENELSRAPKGSVLVKRYKKGTQFYYREGPEDRNGTYMPVADRKLAVALVQKAYSEKVLTAAGKQKKAIEAFLKIFAPDSVMEAYNRAGALRQPFLKAYELPDLYYAEAWQTAEYERKPFREDTPIHITQKQERVRSKSEMIIANELYHAEIPYRYECPLKLRNQIIHPDFTILRMRDRKEVYWEHLGMMDDAEYRNNAFQRIREYEANGIYPGVNLILTVETFRLPLNAAIVKQMISCYLN